MQLNSNKFNYITIEMIILIVDFRWSIIYIISRYIIYILCFFLCGKTIIARFTQSLVHTVMIRTFRDVLYQNEQYVEPLLAK